MKSFLCYTVKNADCAKMLAVMWRQDIQWRHVHTTGWWMLWVVWIKYRRDTKYIYAEELQKASGKREFSAVGLEILSKQRTSMSQGTEVYRSLTYFDQWEREKTWCGLSLSFTGENDQGWAQRWVGGGRPWRFSLHMLRNLYTLLLSLMEGEDSQSDCSDRFCFGLKRSSAGCDRVDGNGKRQEDVRFRAPWRRWLVVLELGERGKTAWAGFAGQLDLSEDPWKTVQAWPSGQ